MRLISNNKYFSDVLATSQKMKAGDLESIQDIACEEEEPEPKAYSIELLPVTDPDADEGEAQVQQFCSIELVPISDNHGKEEQKHDFSSCG
jgi:hypothetical protein